MDVALWIVQVLLALAFLLAGGMKLLRSKEQLVEQLAWVEDFGQNIVKAIGTVEVLGALGLILPVLTNILPFLTPLAAIGLVLDMLGAAFTHFRRKEPPMIAVNVVLLLLAAFVAYGRIDLLIGS